MKLRTQIRIAQFFGAFVVARTIIGLIFNL